MTEKEKEEALGKWEKDWKRARGVFIATSTSKQHRTTKQKNDQCRKRSNNASNFSFLAVWKRYRSKGAAFLHYKKDSYLLIEMVLKMGKLVCIRTAVFILCCS
jgi:hypothetical protein